MKLDIDWSSVCTPDVQRMNWETADRVCSAVIAFADGRPVYVERAREGDPSLIRIPVRGGVALARIDTATRTLFVWRIFAARG